MINSATAQTAVGIQKIYRHSTDSAGNAKRTSVDKNDLFNPGEMRTLENMYAYAKENGASTSDVREVEVSLIHARVHDRSASLKETIGNQIKGIQGGHIDGDVNFLQDLFSSWDSLQGLDLNV